MPARPMPRVKSVARSPTWLLVTPSASRTSGRMTGRTCRSMALRKYARSRISRMVSPFLIRGPASGGMGGAAGSAVGRMTVSSGYWGGSLLTSRLSVCDPDHTLFLQSEEDRRSISSDWFTRSTIGCPLGCLGLTRADRQPAASGTPSRAQCPDTQRRRAFRVGLEYRGHEPVEGWANRGGGRVVNLEHVDLRPDRPETEGSG